MSKDIVVKKGLDLRLVGAPSHEIEEAEFSKDYSIYPVDFHGVYPKLIVKENESVKAGEALFFDKNSQRVKFVSPISGKIKEIVRGERRKVLEIKIEADKNISYKKITKLKSEKPTHIIDFLLENGLWPFFKQRPYDVIAAPNSYPKEIFIIAVIGAAKKTPIIPQIIPQNIKDRIIVMGCKPKASPKIFVSIILPIIICTMPGNNKT